MLTIVGLVIVVVVLAVDISSVQCSHDKHTDKQKYVVYMGGKRDDEHSEVLSLSHHHMLSNLIGSKDEAVESLVHSYTHAFKGFSAWLTQEQAEAISKSSGVVNVFPSRKVSLHTTRSWNFLGLNADILQSPLYNTSSDVIVGVIDSGIWPESESFQDNGMPPVPGHWKGKCDNTKLKNASHIINCNNKLIGARTYGVPTESSKFLNARDDAGHGSHTTSTIAGRLVKGQNLLGLATGDVRGGFPNARIATYKVCSADGCSDDGILAAFDDAIHDGVDILSLSLGSTPTQFEQDSIAIGSFHAMQKGILVSCSAGNDGPDPQTVTNGAPWIFTVGASSVDRSFVSYVKLANNKTLPGMGNNLNAMKNKWSHLISGTDAVRQLGNPAEASFCAGNSLDANKVKGKIVVCTLGRLASIASITSKLSGMEAAGVILGYDNAPESFAYFILPGTLVKIADFNEILSYINGTSNPQAAIVPTQTVFGEISAPRIASFSSRGPHRITPDVLKPDVVAPGVNILAAWSPVVKINEVGKPLYSNYNIISGTSMSCPHVTGAAALLKSIHPTWSPAAIRSALMTTAKFMDDTNSPLKDYDGSVATPLIAGAGEIQPIQAVNPGLVYDLSAEDYVQYLCLSNYTALKYELITGRINVTCDRKVSDINYPSVTVVHLVHKATVLRTVTNVGAPRSSYTLAVNTTDSVTVKVIPNKLRFTRIGQKLSFRIEFTAVKHLKDWAFGSLAWKHGKTIVRSTFAVKA